MSLLVKAAREGRVLVEVTPESAGWQHVGFRAERLLAGEYANWLEPSRELCLVVLSGHVNLQVKPLHGQQLNWGAVQSRHSIFDDQPPVAAYIPAGCNLQLTALELTELAFCSAPSRGGHAPRLILPEHMTRSVRGRSTNTRYVTDILPQTELADSLLVVEVRTPSAHSSSYPPHKHDRDALPAESALEETYYHRINPPQGFVFQRVYTDDRSRDESMAAEDHDVVMVPEGYHPVCVPHGYESYYLNVMAGPTRQWCFQNDPEHAWIVASG